MFGILRILMGNLNTSREMIVPVHGQMYRVMVVPGPLVVRGKTTASRVVHASRVAALAVAYACRPKFQPVRVIGPVD
jgi:hypothetical protein